MKISIITVCFNSARTIADTLISVNFQTYPNIEHVIVDGASKDKTLEIIEEHSERSRKLLSEPDMGFYDALNKGISIASGDVIGILNSDDVYENDTVLEAIVKEFESHECLDMLITGITFNEIDKHPHKALRTVNSKNYNPRLLKFGWMPPHPGLFITKEFYQTVGIYKLDYRIAADYEFVVRCFYQFNPKFKSLPINSVKMRPGGTSTKDLASKITITHEIKRALYENGLRSNILVLYLRLPIKLLSEVVLPKIRRFLGNSTA